MMMRSAHKLPLFAIFAGLLLVGALFASACSGDDNGDEGGNAEVINAINILDNAGLHELATEISDTKEIPAAAGSTYRKMQATTILTAWPDELEAQAKALAGVFAAALAAVDAETPDMAAAAEAATKAHDAEHDFSGKVFEYLYAEAGVAPGGSDDD